MQVTYQDTYALLFHWCLIICSSAHPNQCVHFKGLEILQVLKHNGHKYLSIPFKVLLNFHLKSIFTQLYH